MQLLGLCVVAARTVLCPPSMSLNPMPGYASGPTRRAAYETTEWRSAAPYPPQHLLRLQLAAPVATGHIVRAPPRLCCAQPPPRFVPTPLSCSGLPSLPAAPRHQAISSSVRLARLCFPLVARRSTFGSDNPLACRPCSTPSALPAPACAMLGWRRPAARLLLPPRCSPRSDPACIARRHVTRCSCGSI